MLRQRPLPADVGELIELAAGDPGKLARAAASRNEAPERVLEAARFYVREVLLFPAADAFRVLGVAPDASNEQLKLHHRHLQHWLHPDRRGNDWESVFATRINAAWSELRTPARRATYMARQSQTADGTGPSHGRRRLVSQWRAAPFQERRSLGWLVVGAGAAGCVWLAVLIDRQAAAPALEWSPTRAELAPTESPSPPRDYEAALERARADLVMAELAPTESRPPPRDYQAALDHTAALRADLAMAERAVAPAPVQAPKPLPARDALGVEPQPDPAMAPSLTTQAKPRVSRLASNPPAYTAWVDDRSRQVVAQPPVPVTARRVPAPAAAPVSASSPAPAPAPVRWVESSPAPAPAPAAVPAAVPAVALAPAAAAPTPQRVSQLRRRADLLTAYLGGASGPVPPIWRNVAAQDSAADLRERLGRGRVNFSEPAWRISAEHASLTARMQRPGAPALELRAGFVWREGMWLVETLRAEDLQ
ncbi:MAG: J domain-containing protein [Pseudoxanthomonas sp.]